MGNRYSSQTKGLKSFGRAFYAHNAGFNPADVDGDCLTLLNADGLEDNIAVFNGRSVTVSGRLESRVNLQAVMSRLPWS